MNKLKLLSLSLLALFAVSSLEAQVALNTTTLSAAVTSTATRTILVTSATGITAPSLVTGTTISLLIDKELMTVEAVSGTTFTVQRGAAGTRASLHASGANVYAGVSNYFSAYDRIGACTSTNEVVLPVFNTVDGFGFDCRSSGQWIQLLNGTDTSGAVDTLRGGCTGVVGSAETEFLNGPACSGATTSTTRQLVPSAGTLANLRVYSSANVVGGSSKDVLTVFKNGSSTALTCTIAASAATCSDQTHSLSVVAGDVLTFQFVTATSDTAANIAVSLEKF